jgi:hypothetical protein
VLYVGSRLSVFSCTLNTEAAYSSETLPPMHTRVKLRNCGSGLTRRDLTRLMHRTTEENHETEFPNKELGYALHGLLTFCCMSLLLLPAPHRALTHTTAEYRALGRSFRHATFETRVRRPWPGTVLNLQQNLRSLFTELCRVCSQSFRVRRSERGPGPEDVYVFVLLGSTIIGILHK